MIKIKFHEAYRKIVAVCDSDLVGKKFTEGKLQLDIKESFYSGDEVKDEKEALELLRCAQVDDATFNFVGKKSIEIGLKAGVIGKEGIIKVQGIPHAMGLL